MPGARAELVHWRKNGIIGLERVVFGFDKGSDQMFPCFGKVCLLQEGVCHAVFRG